MGRFFWICLSLLLLILSVKQTLSADLEAKSIARNYYQGVVKIILYDPSLVKNLRLDEKEGYLTRASGFFVTKDGIIFTNKHVVEWCVDGYVIADWMDENKQFHEMDVVTYVKGIEKDPKYKKIYYVGHAKPIIQVFHGTGEKDFNLYNAEVITMGEVFDGAIIRITSEIDGKPVKRTFTPLPLGDSSKVPMGEDLVILGYPAEYEESDLTLDLRDTLTMSFGRQSGWDYVFDPNGMIKTDAIIHEGNSGGPVFDDNEKVIGIATAMGVKTQIGLVEGINDMYYIASGQPKVLDQLLKTGLIIPNEKKNIKTVSGKAKPLPKIKLDPVKR